MCQARKSLHGPWYKKATSSQLFSPEDVFGPNACHVQGPKYRRHVLPGMDVVCSRCGSKMWLDEKLKNSSLRNSVFSLCCNSGKFMIPSPLPPPELLLSWITDHSSEPTAKDLHQYIRAYNIVFAFASLVVEQVRDSPAAPFSRRRPGISTGASSATNANETFRINGTIYHRIGSLRSADGKRMHFLTSCPRKWILWDYLLHLHYPTTTFTPEIIYATLLELTIPITILDVPK
ncbi:hypothetical protein [Absidia glauca]|uniref:Uncharacterized protein n=1 Tax=Absidia glauca TaxID=4829 RepID=A0A163KDG3_ABSGL|nr:hypothetical protein [Absidia glauca]